MQHIYVNFKRFDVPASMGGVNRLSDAKDYASTIVKAVCPDLKAFAGKAEFVHFYPESLLPSAIEGADPSILSIGCQGVYRADVAPGGNFGAFTTNRPAAAMAAIGCTHTIIGHCEERNDKNELIAIGGCTDRTKVNEILNKEVLAAQKRSLSVLYCVGEKDTELDAWDSVIREQLEIGLQDADLSKVVIGYERLVKKTLGDVPVVYGGGLKEENAAMLSSIDEIDGGLIALTRFSGEIGFYPEEYLRIVELYMNGKGGKA